MNEFLQQLLGGAAGAGLLYKAYERLGTVGDDALTGMGELARTQLEQAAFRPYTVTSATGSQFGITQDPTTGQFQYGLQLSPEEQAFQQRMFGRAGDFFTTPRGATGLTDAGIEAVERGREFMGQAAMPTMDREQAVFERIRAAQRPEEERQRLATEERLAAQGRLGLRTAQFGGAPEQFALAQAQEEARNRAMLSAMQQAQAEQAQQANIGSQFAGLGSDLMRQRMGLQQAGQQLGMTALGASYLPQAQLLSAITPGMTAAGQQQQAQMYGTGLFGEARATGLEALLGASLGQANLAGALGGGLLSGALGSGYDFDIPIIG
jgi:hypothetical protein